MSKKGTSTKPTKKIEEVSVSPNLLLQKFLKDNELDFKVSVFSDNYVYVEGQGFLFFDKPQLIYKAKVK